MLLNCVCSVFQIESQTEKYEKLEEKAEKDIATLTQKVSPLTIGSSSLGFDLLQVFPKNPIQFNQLGVTCVHYRFFVDV